MKERNLGVIQRWILRSAYNKENESREPFSSQDVYVSYFNLNGEPASDTQRVLTHNSLNSLIGRALITKNHGERASRSGHIYYSLTQRGKRVAYRLLKKTKKEEKKEKEPEMGEKKFTPEKIVRLVRRSMSKQNERF
jgi:hypothetical protein